MLSIRPAMIASALALLAALPARAEGKIEDIVTKLVESKLRVALSSPAVIDAVKAQNAAHATLTQADIDRLDKQWRAETKAGDKPLIGKTMGNPLSAYLTKVKADGKGLYTEIFVMDDKGLNVGQSDVTSDYWQGDEAKWQKTFSVGPAAIFIDKIEKDESTQVLQSQVSFSIVDPASKAVIGAVTVGINVDELQ